jgi:aspartate aminotransferase
VSDEVYSTFTYTDEGHVSIAARAKMRDRTVVVNAVSKTYGMTGWRIGYAAAPLAVASAMVTVQSHMTSNPSSIAQRGALAALAGPQDWLAAVRDDYAKRRLDLVDGVRRIRGLSAAVPDGSFFAWVDMSWWIGRRVARREIAGADDLAAVLLDDVRVAVMPGTAFGSPTHLRLSFAASPAEVSEGLARVRGLLGES